jgi:hypothetical protein
MMAAGALWAGGAQASEGGASVYLLGSGGPEAAVVPPIQGVFFANTTYYYSGSSGGGKSFTLGGNLAAGLDATIVADFPSVVWVPTTNLAGGVLVLGGALPFGGPDITVSNVLTGPRERQFTGSTSDSTFVIGDPILTGEWGWMSGNLHVTASALINIPIGDYHEGQLANLAFHRWAEDVSLASTWHDAKSGWDLSGKAGFTFNGENPATDYRTGTEFHLEGAIEKALSPAFSAGLQAYYFNQVSADSGAGAVLGPFQGRVTGVGGEVAYNFLLAKKPATLRLHAATEFDVQNRLQGTAVWLDFSVPLVLRLPDGARAH